MRRVTTIANVLRALLVAWWALQGSVEGFTPRDRLSIRRQQRQRQHNNRSNITPPKKIPVSSTQTFLLDDKDIFLFDDKDTSTYLRKGDYIPIADDPEYGLAHEAWESRPRRDLGWSMVLVIPIITPIIAFLSYDMIANSFRSLVETLSWERAWVPVDGGAYQAKIITPAINGVVLPAIAGKKKVKTRVN